MSRCCSSLLLLLALLAAGPPAANAQQIDGLFADAIEYAQARTVKVYGAGAGRVNSYGSGTIVSPDGLILTMQGVYLDGDQVRVGLPDGQTEVASVLRRNRQYQLALLKVNAATPNFMELSDEPVGEIGDWVLTFSNAFLVAEREEPMSVNLGIISLATSIEATLRSGDIAYQGDLVLIDAITSNPGAGGGAVVTRDGRLVGMIGKVINSSETNTRLNYAVPSRILKQFLEDRLPDLQSKASAQAGESASLGLQLFTLGGPNAAAYVDRVQPEGPAARCGLKPDDLIISLGGEKISTIRDFDAAMTRLAPGRETVIVVKRGNDLIRATLIPDKKQ
jgi:serine protease Do